MPINLRFLHGEIIHDLMQSFYSICIKQDLVPGLLKRVIREEMYLEFTVKTVGEDRKYEAFLDFVEAPIPFGLDTTIQKLKNVCHDDIEAIDLIDQALQRNGGKRAKLETIVDSDASIELSTVSKKSTRPDGTSREAGLRTLRKHAPEFHQKVLNGELSVNRACIEAGLRKVPTLLETAKKAVQKMKPHELQEFKEWLACLS